MSPACVVIVGAGHGGFQMAASLRQGGFEGRIHLIGDEPGLPYQRPPLSKDYLDGTTGIDLLPMRPAAFYADNRIELLAADRVTAIERMEKRVRLASGMAISYDHLVLATGARNRAPPLPGLELDGVCYLRTLAESDALRDRLAAAERVVVIGAGFIGLEFAAVARAGGMDIHILEMADRPMGRALCAETSHFFAEHHRGNGTRLTFGVQAARLLGRQASGQGPRRIVGVELDGGARLSADLVLVSVGIMPNAELAAAAGLETADGIVVDEQLATIDPAISAIGDCAVYPSRHAHRPVRLESVQNAADHARCVADRLLGRPRPYTSVPWFWSEQGKLRLQIVGLTTGYDRTVIRGDRASGAFSAFCFAADRLLGIESVNRPADHALGRRMMAAGTQVTPAQAADPDFDLRSLLSRAGSG